MSSTTVADRAAWLEARRSGCGASDVAGILGESPWASPWSVWADKCGLTPLDDDADRDIDDPMTFGRDLEDIIADRYERTTGLHIAGRQEVIHHPDEPWRFATVDGLVTEAARGVLGNNVSTDPTDALAVFESKYTSDHPWEEIPRHYVIAGQWQMHVTGLTAVHFGVLHLPFGRPMFRTYELELDGSLLAKIIDTVETFWLDHVVTGRPPEPDGHPATTKAIAAAWGTQTTQKVPRIELDDHLELVRQLSELRKQRAVLEWQEERVANGLKHLIGERGSECVCSHTWEAHLEAGGCSVCECELHLSAADVYALSDAYIGGELAVSWRSQTESRVDSKAVRADHGTQYDRTGTKRVLRLHGKWQP